MERKGNFVDPYEQKDHEIGSDRFNEYYKVSERACLIKLTVLVSENIRASHSHRGRVRLVFENAIRKVARDFQGELG